MSLKDIQKVSLDILKDVHSFCVSHNINYSLAYGTLIGAIRHKGFIPWDDDIDIIMTRPDYEHFCDCYKSERYQLSTPITSYLCFTRVYDDKETTSVQSVPWLKGKKRPGVWIDIFPIDSVSNDANEYANQYDKASKLLYLQGRIRSTKKTINDTFVLRSFSTAIVKLARAWVGKILFLNKNIDEVNNFYQQVIQQYSWGSTKHWAQLACADNGPKDFGDNEWLSSYQLMQFEDAKFYVLKGFNEWLSNKYGDYMIIPPESEREQHTLDITKFFWKNK